MENMEQTGAWKKVDEDINELERRRQRVFTNEQYDYELPPALLKIIEELPEKGDEEDIKIRDFSESEKQMKSLRYENLRKAMKQYARIDNEISIKQYLVDKLRKEILQKNPKAVSTRDSVTDMVSNDLLKLRREKDAFKDKEQSPSPEAYVATNLIDFKHNIERTQAGGMVETPYVKESKEWMMARLQKGTPMFLHGHLGAGKTEIALHTARESMLKQLITDDLDTWLSDNPEAVKADSQKISKKYKEIEKVYRNKIKEGNPKVLEEISPYLVIGNRDFTMQDLYTEKTLVVTKFNGKSVEDHVKAIDDEFNTWVEVHKEELNTSKEAQKNKEQAAQKILEAYKLKNTGFGTEVKKIEKELYRAIKEGKPIILDEASAIPATVFISMNDILTKRPGDMAHIPGEDTVRVKEGFCVIMTGNIDSIASLANYIGTEDMNPAFLSRLDIREYTYLPQSTSGVLNEQNNPERNELFMVVSALLARKDGSSRLPEGSWDKVFALAQLARVTQDVFSGKWKKSDMARTKSGDTQDPKLETSVMSPRGILKILQEWNNGQEKDVDKALWDAFIGGIINPEDQHYILQQAQRFGFFMESDGWSIPAQEVGAPLLSLDDVRAYPYKYTQPKDRNTSPRAMIEMIYGKAPERVKFPDIDADILTGESKINLEEVAELQELSRLANKYEEGMKVVIEKEECTLSK